ncbi:MAG: CCA tRNA nucleotidyltransferase [Tissierella sp.]|nr:CCA tRNA nucleotidyltransferase [Tissierella sp.]
MIFNLPDYVNVVLNRLKEYGFDGYIVGGSVRDILLGKAPHDYDVTTNAKPDEIQEIFKDFKTVSVGKEFGTIVVVQDEGSIEVTTYRIEGKYLDGRKPSEVTFSNKIEEDLSRRDFTINSMAYSHLQGLIDPFNGRQDLGLKIIRTVGNPKERFAEDHLRILRGVRFATQLGFKIEDETYTASRKMSYSLSNISNERVREELFKILLSRKPSYGIRLMNELEILDIILPELKPTVGFNQQNPYHDKNVFDHTLCVVDNVSNVLEIRLAALFHDIGKPHTFTIDEKGIGHFYDHDYVGVKMTKEILTRLKCPNDLIKDVLLLIGDHMTKSRDMKDKGLKRLISRVGEHRIFHLMELQKIDRMCTNPLADVDFFEERITNITRILDNHEAYEKNHLAIDGYDIINLGYVQGNIIGEILDYLMEKVLSNPELNNKEKLIELVKNKYKL